MQGGSSRKKLFIFEEKWLLFFFSLLLFLGCFVIWFSWIIHCRHVFKLDELGLEILQIAFPAALALTADPIASLVDTAFIGQIGIAFSLWLGASGDLD